MAKVIQPFNPSDVVAHPENYFRRAYIWQLPVRITHWVNALCITTLFLTGLYIGRPILTSSGEPANHFLMGHRSLNIWRAPKTTGTARWNLLTAEPRAWRY